MRLGVLLHRHGGDAWVPDIQLFERADVEGNVPRRKFARPPRRGDVPGGARIDEPADRRELQLPRSVKGHRERRPLNGPIPRVPVARRLDEGPGVEYADELAARRVPPGRQEVVHRRSETDQIPDLMKAQVSSTPTSSRRDG